MSQLGQIQLHNASVTTLAPLDQLRVLEFIDQAYTAGVTKLQGAAQKVDAAAHIETNDNQGCCSLRGDGILALQALEHPIVHGDDEGAKQVGTS
jgi:hypothetical protein